MINQCDAATRFSIVENEKNKLITSLDEAIKWYAVNSKKRSRWARGLRVCMIVLGGMSVLIPLLLQIKELDLTDYSSLWASVSTAIVAILFAIEKYYGFSEAWMRFMLAKQDLEKLKEELDIQWLKLVMPESASLEAALEELLRISAARHEIVKKETEAWAMVLQEGVKNTNPSQGALSTAS